MTAKRKKAAAPTATHKKTSGNQDNRNDTELSRKRAEKIAQRRADMPRQFRKVYDIAMSGRSLRAAVNSQCIECMGYVFNEVKLCCSPQCPLFLYRPVRGVSYGLSGLSQSGAGSEKTCKGGNHAG